MGNEDVGSESEHAWYHGSHLTCQICKKTFANDQWYFHHFSKIHGMTKEQYNTQYGKQLEIWHQYQCLICKNEIRWKYSSIRQHLKQVHGTTIQDYEAQYMDMDMDISPVQKLPALKPATFNTCGIPGVSASIIKLEKPSVPITLP